MTRYSRETWFVVIATVAVRLAYALYTGFTADDAFITFRYADNIARGLGFVYNDAQRVLGTTTPLFTLILALASFLKFPLVGASLVVSIAASAATAVVIYRFAVALRFRLLSFVPVIVYILWPRSLPGETCGMETALFTLLVTSALYFRFRGFDYYAVGMATLATVTRPEGAFVLALVGIAVIAHHPHRWWHYALVSLSLIGPWVVFGTIYFGSFIPNTIAAKTALYSQFGQQSLWETLRYLLALHTPFGWVVLAAVTAGAIWFWRSQRFGRLELLWLVGMYAFYLFSGAHIFFWYVVPAYPVHLLFASAALVPLWDRLPLTLQHAPAARIGLGAVLCAALLYGAYGPATFYKTYQESLEAMHQQVGLYLFAESNPKDLVAAEDIGYIGYYSQRTILDRDGLVSPEAIPYNRAGSYLPLILDYRPDWVVVCDPSPISPFINDDSFLNRYEHVRAFQAGQTAYRIYRQRLHVDQPAPGKK